MNGGQKPTLWRALKRALVCVSALAVLTVALGSANADRVSSLISKLKTSRDYKVRLSSALALSKTNDARTIPAFVSALRDRDKTVRGVAAASLGKIVTSKTALPLRKKALTALDRARKKDKNAFVRGQAAKAFESLKRLGAPMPKADAYLHVGTMTAEAGGDAVRSLMRKTTQSALRKNGSWALTWPGGKEPKKRDLGEMPAFHIDGTVNKLDVRKRGSRSTITCKVSMLIASYPEKSMFGFLKGGASVEGSSSSRDIALAKEDCVAAVVEDLVVNKIVPTIKARVR